jgi:hypothetical protein
MTLRDSDSARFGSLTITGITPHALETFQSQWDHDLRVVDWDWHEEVKTWRRRRPSYWEIAIWHKQTLCGLVLGGPSRRRGRLYVEGIEGNPGSNPLKKHIIPIALLASERYAALIGSKEVWLVNPEPKLLDIYARAGYLHRPPNKFLAKALRMKSHAVKAVGEDL